MTNIQNNIWIQYHLYDLNRKLLLLFNPLPPIERYYVQICCKICKPTGHSPCIPFAKTCPELHTQAHSWKSWVAFALIKRQWVLKCQTNSKLASRQNYFISKFILTLFPMGEILSFPPSLLLNLSYSQNSFCHSLPFTF